MRRAYKAPGRPSGISNAAIPHAYNATTDRLTATSNASVSLGRCCLDQWKCFATVTLRKPGEDDCSTPRAFRPIALEATLGEVVERAVTTRMSCMSETHGLLPKRHFDGRPERNTPNAPTYLQQRRKDGWRKRKVASVVLPDVSQVCLTVSHERFLHIMWKRRLWIWGNSTASFPTGRRAT